jgi:hypothetical protein
MRKYARLPALLILGVAAIASAAIALTRTPPASIDEITQSVKNGTADGETWFKYGDLLRKKNQFHDAAYAYKQAQKKGCASIRAARFGQAVSLAQDPADPAGEIFFAYINDELIPADAKTALDALDSPEAQSRKASPRFDPTRQSAERQAVD